MKTIHTPNLGLGNTVFDREREYSRFRGSGKRVKGEYRGSKNKYIESTEEVLGGADRRSR